MRRAGQHVNICAGAEHPAFRTRDDDACDLGVLEADALQGIVKFDVHTQIVGIKFQFVAGPQTAVFVDIHGECSDAAFDFEIPVAEFALLGAEENEFPGFNLLHRKEPRARAAHGCVEHAAKAKYRTVARTCEEL